jgi:methylated-DNA-[protein]-cysteine S-methyltransferase
MPPAANSKEMERILCRQFGAIDIEEGGPMPSRLLRELKGYFSGTLKKFETPCRPSGTPFQMEVWDLVSQIPYGQTRNYGEIAAALGKPMAGRAVGQANGRNPLPLVVPCHRVVGFNGRLCGYSSGVDLKRWLLEWEQNRTS